MRPAIAATSEPWVRDFEARDRDRWEEFADQHPQASAFHTPGWCEVLQENFGYRSHHLVAIDDRGLCGVMPLLSVRSPVTGTRLLSTPFATYGGPLGASDEATAALVASSRAKATALRVGHLELRFSAGPAEPPGAEGMLQKTLYYGFRKPIPGSADELLASIPQKSRRMVRKAIKAGLVGKAFVWPQARRQLDRAWSLIALSMRNLGSPSYPRGFLRRLLSRNPDRWFLWAIFNRQEMVSVALTARHRGVLYPHIQGALPAYRKVGSNNFMIYSLMLHGAHSGHVRFDFSRSKVDTGPYHFKRHFGFEPELLRYRYHLVRDRELPNVSPNNPRYELAIKCWRQLPLGFTKRVGPLLVGHFA